MRKRNKIGVSTILLAISSVVFTANCTADEMTPQTPREIRQSEREIRRSNAANRVPPKLTAMSRTNTLSYEYYQSSIAERAEANRKIHSQPHPRMFTKIGIARTQMRKDHDAAGNYVVEWFCYIKGNGVAIWDHRP